MHGGRKLKRLEYPRRATRSRRCALKVRIASAGTHPRSACICGQALHAFQPVLLPLMQLFYLPNPYRIASSAMRRLLVDRVCRRGATLPGCVTVQRWLAVAYFAHPMYLQYA